MHKATHTEGLIERRDHLPPEEFVREYLNPHRPVIIADGLRDWKAVGKWTPEFFRESEGEKEFKVDGKLWKLRDLVSMVLESDAGSPAPYLRNLPIRDIRPELLEDISPLPAYLKPNWLETKFHPASVQQILGRAIVPDIFIGGAGRSFPFLHYDLLNSHAYLSQVYGHKTYTLYSPAQSSYMYPSRERPNHSTVNNIEDPDLEQFPLFANARGIQSVLGPGEMLFIPAGWWHTAKNLDPSITVSINVVNSSNWNGLVIEQFQNARRSRRFSHRVAAVPLAAYLTGVGLYRSLASKRVHD